MSCSSHKYHLCVVGFVFGVMLSFFSLVTIMLLYFKISSSPSLLGDIFIENHGEVALIVSLLDRVLSATLFIILFFCFNRFVRNVQTAISINNGLTQKLENIRDSKGDDKGDSKGDEDIIIVPTMFSKRRSWIVIACLMIFLLLPSFLPPYYYMTEIFMVGDKPEVTIEVFLSTLVSFFVLPFEGVMIICFIMSVSRLLKRNNDNEESLNDIILLNRQRNKWLLISFLAGMFGYGVIHSLGALVVLTFYAMGALLITYFIPFLSGAIFLLLIVLAMRPFLRCFMAVMGKNNQMLKDKIDEEMKVGSDC